MPQFGPAARLIFLSLFLDTPCSKLPALLRYLVDRMSKLRPYDRVYKISCRISKFSCFFFKKFIPFGSKKGEETGHSIFFFIKIAGLPYSLHSDNHSNFKEGFFKKMMRKFGICQTFTEPHSPWRN